MPQHTLRNQPVHTGVGLMQPEPPQAMRINPQPFRFIHDHLRDNMVTLGKLIERAKGLVMAHQGLDESGAHALLRKLAMDRSLRLEQVAEQILNSLGAARRGTGGKG